MGNGDASEEDELVNSPQSNSESDDFELIEIRASNTDNEVKSIEKSNESNKDITRSEGTSAKKGQDMSKGQPTPAQKREHFHTSKYQLTKEQIESLNEWVMSAVQAEQDTGIQFLDTLHNTRAFNNPGIYEEMITYCKLDAYGSEMKVNTQLEADEYCEELKKIQEQQMQERAEASLKEQ